jgi:LacI family transcriptional regulator
MSANGIREVADRAGVSLGTVSNVLNQPHLVSASTRAKVEAAIRELNFVRNDAARQLRTGRSSALGLIVLDVRNPFFTDMARGVEDAANDIGCAVILCNSDESRDKQKSYLKLLLQHRVQGVLVTPVSEDHQDLQALRDRGIPVVLLDHVSEDSGECSVGVDDVAGGNLAVTHLLGRGHDRITFVSGPLTLRQCQDRLAGARAAMSQADRDPSALNIIEVASLNVTRGRRAGEQILASRGSATAVFCGNDLLALGVLQAAIRAGVRVPDDLAIVGYDDIDFAGAAGVPLTSVHQPSYEMGRTAAELLLDEVRAEAGHQHMQVRFEPELVERSSS